MKITDEDIYNLLTQQNLSEQDKRTILKMLGRQVEDIEDENTINKLEDKFSQFVGSWSFILISILFILVWMFLNSYILPKQYVFDAFPYVLLNLVLACIAAIQAPIIMMSQNRQDKRESLKSQNDYEVDLKTILIIQDLYKKMNEINSKLDKILESNLNENSLNENSLNENSLNKGDDNEF